MLYFEGKSLPDNSLQCIVNDIQHQNRPFFNAENMKALRKSIQEAEEGKLTAHELIEE